VATAKGLGGGFPVGACLAKEKAAKALTAGSHGSTFGGNPLAMAVANAVLDVILADGFLETVRQRAQRLSQGLAELVRRHPDRLEETRGFGLLLGLKCRIPNTELMSRLRDKHLLVATAGDNVLRILPPLIVEESHIEEGLRIIDGVLSGWGTA